MALSIDWWVEHRDAAAGVAALVAAALVVPFARRLDRLLLWLRESLHIDRAAPWLLAFVAFVIAATVAYVRPPLPAVHDEFSYLLSADTFSRGRLANPAPPLPEHFETFHVLVEPNYASKYPPGQGLALALGQVVFGHPVAGLWLMAAAFAASLWWALRAWVGPGVALLWALLGSLRFATTGYWVQSYWGGALAAIGGALALGAALRLAAEVRTGRAAVFAVGCGILAATRPFEGLVACAALSVVVTIGIVRQRRVLSGRVLVRAGCVAAAILVACLAWLAHYNAAVTGSATTLPYEVHETRYASAPNFLFQEPLEPPTYRHPEFERFWAGWVKAVYDDRRALSWLAVAREKLGVYAPFYVGWVWLPFLVVGLFASRAGPLRFWLVAGSLAILVESFDHRHYAAPFTAGVVLLCARASQLCAGSNDVRVRVGAAAAVAVVLVATLGESVAEGLSWRPTWPAQRAELIGELEALPGDDLVFVRTDHNDLDDAERRRWENIDWVFGGADLASQSVLFARDLGPASNQRLLEHFGPRRAWRLVLPLGLRTGRAFDGLEPIDVGEQSPTGARSGR